jgi:hypothetical protein
MEHSLHLAACHVLSKITPVQSEKRPKARAIDEDNDNDILVDGSVSDECSAILSHGIRKLLGLIRQVRDH